MLCVPSRTKVQEYKLLKSEIDELVGKINGCFGTLDWSPILYLYRSVPFEKLVALYSAADLALVTPLRDGMNLVAKEYLACQGIALKGVLVLSETAGAAAEHGAWLLSSSRDGWELSEPGLTDSWKQNIYPILEMFSVRTPGSFVEEKAFALAWHYRNTDPKLGSLRAKELADSLHDILAGTDLQVLQGKKVLEIKPVGINKGKAAIHWLGNEDEFDFILAMGDDWTDEDIFSVLPATAWSIKVGFTPITEAKYFLKSSDKARMLLKTLAAPDYIISASLIAATEG